VDVTGSAGVSAVGDGIIKTSVDVTPAGLSATGYSNDVSIKADVNLLVNSLFVSGEVGAIDTSTGASVDVTGLLATTAIGSITVTVQTVATVTGVGVVGFVGTIDLKLGSTVTPVGLNATVYLYGVLLTQIKPRIGCP
jgi:hypothetical protein